MVLKVSGRSISDPKFSGSNVRDTENNNRFSKSGSETLVNNIRKASSPALSKTNSNSNKVSIAGADMAKNLANNTEKVQQVINSQGEEVKENIKKLFSMMNASQKKTGDASVAAIKELILQVEKIRESAGDDGDDLVKTLGADKAQQTLAKSESVTGSIFRKHMKTDKGLGFKDSIKQAFTKEKMFGLEPSAKSKIQEAEVKVGQEVAADGLEDASEKLIEVSTEETDKKTLENIGEKSSSKNAEEESSFNSGSDVESPAARQVELLEDILEELKEDNESSESGTGMIMGGLSLVAGAVTTGIATLGTGLVSLGASIGATVLGGVTSIATTIGSKVAGLGTSLAETLGLKSKTSAITNTSPTKPPTNVKPTGTRRPSLLSRVGKGAKSFGRIALKGARFLGAPGAILGAGAAAYGGVKGFNADPDADFFGNIKNAGSSALNMASMGLFGSSSDEIAAEAQDNSIQPNMEANRQSSEPSRLQDPGTMSGVYKMDPNVTPTGAAIDNMTAAANTPKETVVNNIQNITNNTSGGGNSAPPILVNPSTIKNTEFNMMEFMKRVH
jgi:hypothetical protein